MESLIEAIITAITLAVRTVMLMAIGAFTMLAYAVSAKVRVNRQKKWAGTREPSP